MTSVQDVVEERKLLLTACRILAGLDQDHASLQNGIGFNGRDGEFGHKLAQVEWERWTPKMMVAARLMLIKYHRQLPFDVAKISPPNAEEIDAFERQKALRKSLGINGNQQNTLHGVGEVVEQDRLFIFRFPCRPDWQLLAELRELPGRKWIKLRSEWSVPVNPLSAKAVFDFAVKWKLSVPDSMKKQVEALAAHAEFLAKQSKASSSDFSVEGLGGELRPFQRAGVEYALAARRCFIADQMGLGKTVQALAAVHAAHAYPALVVVPASVLMNWEREARHWLPQAMTSVLNGKYGNPNADILVTTYGQAEKWAGYMKPDTEDPKGKKLIFEPGRLAKKGLRAIILDEAHYVKNQKAQRTQLMEGLVKFCNPDLVLLLTGTPVVNRPAELVTPLKIIGRLEDFGGWRKFTSRYCGAFKQYGHWNTQGGSNLEELNQKMRALCYIRREKSQVLTELPAKQRVTVPMQIDNRPAYEKAEADVARYFADKAEQNEEFRQSIAGLSDEDRRKAISERRATAAEKASRVEAFARINALKELTAKGKLKGACEWIEDVLEGGSKLVMFADHVAIQHALLKAFPRAAHVLGSDDAETRQQQVDSFQNNDDTRLIVCSLGAAGIGITLTAASDVAFMELGWTPAAHDQAEDRCHRIGQTDSVTAWYLLGENTMDEEIAELIDGKRAIVNAATDGRVTEKDESILEDLKARIMAKAGLK